MKLFKLIWPWSRLGYLEWLAEYQEERIDELRIQRNAWQKAFNAAAVEADEHIDTITALRAELAAKS